MKRYDNGEPIIKDRMEDEEWYSYYQTLIEIVLGEEFTFSLIDDPGRLVELFHKDWEEFKDKHVFPSEEQILRWSVLLTERHNNTYNSHAMIRAFRNEYAGLKESLRDWTDWDIVMLEIVTLEKKTGSPEFFKDVDVEGGLVKNKFWIYGNSGTA